MDSNHISSREALFCRSLRSDKWPHKAVTLQELKKEVVTAPQMGANALAAAVDNVYVEAAQVLLELDIEISRREFSTLIQNAITSSQVAMVDLLLEWNAYMYEVNGES
jgi:hypothetical protein